MFTVVTEKGTIRVEFEHARNSGKDALRRGTTTCAIYRIENEINDRTTLGRGISTCHLNDNWSYAKGRKLALARAVRKAFKRHPEFQMRLLIWNCYHLTVSGGARFVQPMTGSLTGSYRGVFQYTTQGGTT